MTRLVTALHQYGAAIEADFASEYKERLAPGSQGQSWRRFAVLLDGLPLDSRFARAVAAQQPDTEDTGPVDVTNWPLAMKLQALLVDAVQVLIWIHGGGQGKPHRIVKPPAPPKPQQVLDEDQITVALAAIGPARTEGSTE